MKTIMFLLGPGNRSSAAGYFLRTVNLSKALVHNGNRVVIIHLVPRGDTESEENYLVDSGASKTSTIAYDPEIDSIPGKTHRTLIGLFPGLLYTRVYTDLERLRGEVRKLAVENNVDVVHAQGHFAGLAVSGRPEIPWLLDLTDSTTLQVLRSMMFQTRLDRKLTALMELLWTRKYEKSLAKNSRIVTVVSAKDRETLNTICPGARIETVPNGIDYEYYAPRKYADDSHPSIIFHGSMDFPPNEIAVTHVYEKVLPLARMQVNGLKFLVVGRNPSARIMRYHNGTDVLVTGSVPDVREYLARSSVVVEPMFVGGGMKNKILEAASMGKPIITNTMGAESFSEDFRKCICIVDSDEDMANSIADLMDDVQKRMTLGMRARQAVIRNYSWAAAAEKFDLLYDRLHAASESNRE